MVSQDRISRLAQQIGERLQGASQAPEDIQKGVQQVGAWRLRSSRTGVTRGFRHPHGRVAAHPLPGRGAGKAVVAALESLVEERAAPAGEATAAPAVAEEAAEVPVPPVPEQGKQDEASSGFSRQALRLRLRTQNVTRYAGPPWRGARYAAPVRWACSTGHEPSVRQGAHDACHHCTRAGLGLDAPEVQVEVHLANGLPGMTLVGLPETAVRESRERVRSALATCGLDYPLRRITLNLAPADLPKEGWTLRFAHRAGSAGGFRPVARRRTGGCRVCRRTGPRWSVAAGSRHAALRHGPPVRPGGA